MRKWTYLVAALLMTGTTATFTGCIDTDEPDGITALRGAKAELIKAQTAVKLVEVEWQKADVAYKELKNKEQELDNQFKEYTNQMQAIEVKLKELLLEKEQANTAQAKAEADAKIAEANKNKAFWENEMAKDAEIFKAAMLNFQTQTAQAQEAYDNAMKLIEAGKLLLSDGEKAIIDKAQENLFIAAAALNADKNAVIDAQKKYDAAITDKDMPTLPKLQAALKIAQITVETKEIAKNDKDQALSLVENSDATQWDAKVQDLKKKEAEYKSEKAKADVAASEIENSEAYRAASKKIEEMGDTLEVANKNYAKAIVDSTDATQVMHSIKEYKSEPVNAALKELFNKSGSGFVLADGTELSGYSKTGVFSYEKATYRQTDYSAELEKTEVDKTVNPFKQIATVEGWINALGKYTVDENGTEWEKLNLAGKEKAVEAAKKAFDAAKADWTISANAVKGTATTVPTTELKKVTDVYNKAYADVVSAVTAYNAAWDAVYKAAYDAAVKKMTDGQLDLFYRQGMIAELASADLAAWNALGAAGQTTSKLEALLADPAKQATAKVDADKKIAEWLKIEKTKTDLAAAGKAAGDAALIADKDDKEKAAKEALVNAADVAAEAVKGVNSAIGNYKGLAAIPYGQLLSNTLTVEAMTGKDAFYGDDAKNAGHYKALRSDISTDEYTKLAATKLDNTTALTALTATSTTAFGNKKLSSDDRLLEVTEAMVRAYIKVETSSQLTDFGKLGAMMFANDDLQLCKDLIAAAELIKPLKADMEKVLVNLNAEIDDNTALMTPFIEKADEKRMALNAAQGEVKKAEDERAGLTAEAKATSGKYDLLAQDMGKIIDTVNEQIKALKDSNDDSTTVEGIINYWKDEVAKAEEEVANAELGVSIAEKNIEMFNNGQYTQAYIVEQAKLLLQTASDKYDATKVVYDNALDQVKKVLDTLTK